MRPYGSAKTSRTPRAGQNKVITLQLLGRKILAINHRATSQKTVSKLALSADLVKLGHSPYIRDIYVANCHSKQDCTAEMEEWVASDPRAKVWLDQDLLTFILQVIQGT